MAGVLVGLGLAFGVAPGTVPGFVAAVALITVGRRPDLRATISLALLALALGLGALRWSTVDLQDLIGIQEVLGPSLLVGPQIAAAGVVLSAVAALAVLSVWAATPPEPILSLPGPAGVWSTRVWTLLETWAPAAGVTSVFFRPAQAGLVALAPLALAAIALSSALLLRRSKPMYSWAVLASTVAMMVVAAALLVETG